MTVRYSLSEFTRFRTLRKLLKLSSVEEVATVILNSYSFQYDEHPVIDHLSRKMDNSDINFDCEELNMLEIELECFTALLDTEIEQQLDPSMTLEHFELIRWITPTDVMLGTIGGY